MHNIKKLKKAKSMKSSIIGLSIVSILLVSLASIVYSIESNYKKDNAESSKTYELKFTKNGQLLFLNKNLTDIITKIDIEIADNEAKRAQGLMYRHSIPEDVGMLFIFEEEKPISFWMKNTYVPLDILFINKSFEIVTIRENNPPLSESPISSDLPALYAVEVIAGFCKKHNINTGDRIKFEILKMQIINGR